MPTDTATGRTRGAEFALRAVAWSLGLFGLLSLGWVERHVLLPLTQFQGYLAAGLVGAPARPITTTLACSGADVVAICLGAILAYPERWRSRLVGAGVGLALILTLNTLRIGTLGRLAASPSLFHVFHVYLWPAALSLAVAGYVFGWMRLADERRRAPGSLPLPARATAPTPEARGRFRPSRRFALLAAVLLLVFTAAAPIYLESAGVLSVAAFITHAAAAALRILGVEAQASANQLWTPRGSFLVTQECIATPLIPVYVAAVLALGGSWRTKLPALLAAVPLFVGLGIARLLVVALPPSLAASPVHLIHAFFQIALAAVVVVCAAFRRRPGRGAAVRQAIVGMSLGTAFFLLMGAPYTRLVFHAARVLSSVAIPGAAGPQAPDPQGAVALLPAFQVGLYLALWVAACIACGWRRFVAGLALLCLSQPATLAILPLFADRLGPSLQVQGVRAWAVAGPVLAVALVHLIRARAGVARSRPSKQAGVRG